LDKTIITAFLIVASVLSAVVLFNAVYPAVVKGGEAMAQMEDRIGDRLQSQIVIIHATASGNSAYIWVKNIGSSRLITFDNLDVFFGLEGDFSRIPQGFGAGSIYWTGELENNDRWDPTSTLKITIVDQSGSLPSGRYFIKVVIPNGISDESFFSK
jgi:archaellum component FlaG (FlaF/FlaG flagellin family)